MIQTATERTRRPGQSGTAGGLPLWGQSGTASNQPIRGHWCGTRPASDIRQPHPGPAGGSRPPQAGTTTGGRAGASGGNGAGRPRQAHPAKQAGRRVRAGGGASRGAGCRWVLEETSSTRQRRTPGVVGGASGALGAWANGWVCVALGLLCGVCGAGVWCALSPYPLGGKCAYCVGFLLPPIPLRTSPPHLGSLPPQHTPHSPTM